MNKGKTVFSQVMDMIPRREFDNIVSKYNGNRYAKQLSCHDQFLIMCMAQYADKNSLRDIEASLIALDSAHKLYACGIRHAAAKSTLADANEKRSWHIYEELGQVLIKKARALYITDPFRLDIDNMVYAFDSSTISLCLKLCPWAKYKSDIGGVKMHTQLDLRGNVPVFVRLTEASVHDVNVLDGINVEMGAIYLIDKGYVDFKRLYRDFQAKDAFFVTRIKDNTKYEVIEAMPVEKYTGVISDEKIRLTGVKSKKDYPCDLRLVTYEDFTDGTVYRFLTDIFSFEALTIAELYRERWQVELFFKWIKQHLHIKSFYGTSQNAVYTQIWIAVCAFLLLALAKKKNFIEQSLYLMSQIVSTMMFEKINLHSLFERAEKLVGPSDQSVIETSLFDNPQFFTGH